MLVTPSDIAIELGRPSPEQGSPTEAQWARWIDRAYRQIRTRAESLGVTYASLDPDVVGDVVTYAVVRRATRPADGAESTTDQIGVDDGSWNQTRRFPSGLGDILILDEW
ncbi:MAG: hypothetical protein Q4F67_11645, partial [Propionibacteriaceae bacterium]|nr:hypothetical protein [Propionibacteriaceae bacterium]